MAETQGDRPRKQRLFVALDLPDKIRAGVAAWGREELVDPALKPVRPESLHVTLVFLGHREAAEVEAIADVVRETESEMVLSKLEDPIPIPGPRRASAFALPAPSPATGDLQRELAARLAEEGLYEPEEREYWPHVTVARVRSEGRGSRRPAAVARWPTELPKSLKEPFYGVRLTLYRSELQPGGSRYVPLAQVELPRSGQQ
ncbi:MAG TPA: RNA 2',3'-cyclic phosphodiesterase [Solirubrobacterales bacterium]|nr:RNA 2',3'-cyclic phosphodiesterase [Solirubrobacterales bacterium]